MKTILRGMVRTGLNTVLDVAGVKLVSTQWGPRGFLAAFDKARAGGLNPGTIVDVGASNGQWTKECLSVFPHSKYLLIDPLHENRSSLERLADAFPDVRFWSGALGAQPGRMSLHSHGDQSSFLASQEFSGGLRAVEVRPLDSFLDSSELVPPLLIKADVQGFEIEVLKGAQRALELTEMLLLETSFVKLYSENPLAHEVIAYVCSRGFRIHDICTYVQRPGDGRLAQSDILFVAESSRLNAREGWNEAAGLSSPVEST